MAGRMDAWLLWSPRVLGVLVCLYLGLFGLDAFGEGKPFAQALAGFLVHSIPALVLLIAVALSWRREWVGGFVFTGFAALYALWAGLLQHRPEWLLPIGGPPLVVGILFLTSWRRRASRVV